MARKIKIDYIKKFRLCDKAHFLIMKGIAILLVLLAYVGSAYFGIRALVPLAGVGSVMFLFMSGFGLSESFLWKRGVPHYWENKIIKVWIPSVVSLVVFALLHEKMPFDWIGQNPLALSGWFLYVLFACYVLFWLAFEYIEGKIAPVIVLLAAAAIAFVSLEKRTYAEVMLAFPLGVLCSQWALQRDARDLGVKGRLILCGVLLLLSVGGYFLANATAGMLCNLCWMVSKTAMALLLIYGVFCLQAVPAFGIFAPLGFIAYAVYLLMADVLSLTIKSPDLESIGIGMGVLIVSASVFAWLCNALYLWNKKVRRKKNPKLKGNMQR